MPESITDTEGDAHVLHFTHSFIPMSGGTTTRHRALLFGGRHTHHLVAPMSGMGESAHERFGNVEVSRVDMAYDSRVNIPVAKGYLIEREQLRRLHEAAAGIPADIVVGHSPYLYAKAGWKYARQIGRPFVYDIHKLAYDSFISRQGLAGLKKRLRQERHRQQESDIARQADAVIVQTEAIKQRAVDIYGISDKNVHVIPMGIDPVLFDPSDAGVNRDEIRNRLGCEDKICFLYNGNLEPQTGIDFFLDTVAELPPDTKSKMVVVVLGRGSLKRQVEQMSTREPGLVQFLGLLDYEEMPSYYGACDVHVLPYPDLDCWKTNVPTKLLEGMAMERLILASRLAGIGSVLNGQGLTYRPGDRTELKKHIAEVVRNFRIFDSRRFGARKAVIQQYDWRIMRGQLDDLFGDLTVRRLTAHPKAELAVR